MASWASSPLHIVLLFHMQYNSHKYPPFLCQLHKKGLFSCRVEGTSKVEVSEVTDLRLYQPDVSWCEEFQFLLHELKAMPREDRQAYALISFLHCGRVITFYRFHVVLVPQVLSCEADIHPNELDGGAKPKAMLVYAQTELRSSNLKEVGITPHPEGVLLQPQFEGDILKLDVSLDDLSVTPTGLKVTEKRLDAQIFYQLRCQYKEFATPRITGTVPPPGIAMVVI